MASTDNPRDRWLHAEMRKLFATVTRRESSLGTVYLARCDRPLKRVRNFRCEFAFRDRGRLIHAVSRPGVFSHREVDPGARQLMAAMEIAAGDRVLDMGCGSGTVSLAAAFRAEGVNVLAVDSHARAVECTALGAARNGLGNITVEHSAQRAPVRRRGRSTSSWRIHPTMPGFASPASSWKLVMRPCVVAAGSIVVGKQARMVRRADAAVVQRGCDRAVEGLLDRARTASVMPSRPRECMKPKRRLSLFSQNPNILKPS